VSFQQAFWRHRPLHPGHLPPHPRQRHRTLL
jgi:hypothetical protein